MMLIDVVDNRC